MRHKTDFPTAGTGLVVSGFRRMDVIHMEAIMLFTRITPSNSSSSSSRPARRRHQGFRWLGLAVALALGSIPMSASAKAPAENGAQVSQTRLATPAPVPTEARTTKGQDYASREASAKGLEKFEGGSTTIWIGGSTAVIVLLVVLIVVLW
jgi:hypothetical protein